MNIGKTEGFFHSHCVLILGPVFHAIFPSRVHLELNIISEDALLVAYNIALKADWLFKLAHDRLWVSLYLIMAAVNIVNV